MATIDRTIIMDKEKFETQLVQGLMLLLKDHIKTGYDDNGLGEILQCTIDFNYLHNKGALFVKDLNFISKIKKPMSRPKIIFDQESAIFILEALGYAVNKDQYIVKDGAKVKDHRFGQFIKLTELTGISSEGLAGSRMVDILVPPTSQDRQDLLINTMLPSYTEVSVGDELCEFEGDKMTLAFLSEYNGLFVRIAGPNSIVDPGDKIGYIVLRD